MHKKNSNLIVGIILVVLFIFFDMSAGFESNSVQNQKMKSQRVDFTVTARGISSNLNLFSVFVLPNDSLYVSSQLKQDKQVILVQTNSGSLSELPKKWLWVAPSKPGFHALTISHLNSVDTITLQVFVMYPISEVKKGKLNGYKIGEYPKDTYKDLPQYKPPRGFIEVTKENEDMKISPHFILKQFVCKQGSSYPKYIVLRELLILKLELILEKFNNAGYACSTLHVMSGYRTPSYNKTLGNVKYSRHQWGGAADVFIDENPKDGMMDDLNKDKKINWKDAAILYDIVDKMYGTESYKRFIGGLGRYKKTDSHGPFIHVDVRGFRARWDE